MVLVGLDPWTLVSKSRMTETDKFSTFICCEFHVCIRSEVCSKTGPELNKRNSSSGGTDLANLPQTKSKQSESMEDISRPPTSTSVKDSTRFIQYLNNDHAQRN